MAEVEVEEAVRLSALAGKWVVELGGEDPVSMIMEGVDETTELLMAAMELMLLLMLPSSPVAVDTAAEVVMLPSAVPVKTSRPSGMDCARTAGVNRERWSKSDGRSRKELEENIAQDFWSRRCFAT